MNWQRLDLLSHRFAANCDALATRSPDLAAALREHHPVMLHVIAAERDRLFIGQLTGQQIQVIPSRLEAAGAQQVAAQLFPQNQCNEPALVAGLDQGWLWELIYNLPAQVAARPGYRPPLYFLCHSIEQLWIALHVHDWRKMLSDSRAMILVGADAVGQLKRVLIANPRLAPPRVSVTLDPILWQAGMNLDQLNGQVMNELNQRMMGATERFKTLFAGMDDRSLATRLAGPAPLRILGITSRYTTFLQHSMRDWLAGFTAAGHETSLVIEQADHEHMNSLVLAEACVKFHPDLVLMIDHFRAEMGGLPEKIPCVMWIQDHLPNIFAPTAGTAQGPLDFVIGYNRSECVSRFNYPYERFMPAVVAVNEERFAPPELSEEDRRRYACDVCFVSHASLPAEEIIQQQIQQNPQVRRLLEDAFERLREIYSAGHFLSHPIHLRSLIQESMLATHLSLDTPSTQALTDLFTHRINNAMFRHQALEWAAETGVNLHIHGNGWENHPRLKQFAKGPADNQTMLGKIFRCAKINLQVTPHGAVHQRMLEGLASGGFFLIRYVPGDTIDRLYRPLSEWIAREGIESDEQMMARATPEIYKILGEFQRTIGLDPFRLEMKLIDDVRTHADLGFFSSASTLWAEYDQVAFDSKARLHQQIKHYLKNGEQRDEIAGSMRERVLETLTYKATNRRMLGFVAKFLTHRASYKTAAA